MDRTTAQCENVNMAPVKKDLRPLGKHFLKEWREYRKLDQEEVASSLDVSRTLLSKIEGRKSPYTQRTLEAAAGVYGCTPAQLLSQNPGRADNFITLFERAERLDGARRDHVMRIIEAALGSPSG
ncbi:XRE family transcriptional regulator [Pseudaminobacter arsenicus]|uniref:XRE family transcriptional regulator n=1 Tax=Borborobacter arsenicus TaxID=1851146 RepID=A0A432V6V6_9HYPH|nr:helix-turn-helix transcriptional regulator [Pseudaminobacter arsenicus]RUM97888.1 XRE family transcriptional regulator [Pseudaminobacter arsenicus]